MARAGGRPEAEARFATPRNHDRRTLGPEVGKVMGALGTPPMPWQQYVLDVAYELDEETTEQASSLAGLFQPRLWYRKPVLEVPRQSGKTQKAMGRHVHRQQVSRPYGWHQRPLSLYMAQTASDAAEKMVEEWVPILEETVYDPEWADQGERDEWGQLSELVTDIVAVKQYLRANGRESIKWDGGGRIATKPPSRKGGHGASAVQLVDLDESFAHQDAAAEQAVGPAMITSTSPQLWVVSTAGDETSEFLWGKVDDGRQRCERFLAGEAGAFGRTCYFEWSFEDTDDPLDPETWWRHHPALGHTIPVEAVQAEADTLELSEFLRAYGNVWTKTVKRIIPAAAWAKCLDPTAKLQGDLYLAVDAAPGGAEGGRRLSIGIGGRNQFGVPTFDLVKSEPGLSWGADEVRRLTRKWRRIQMVYLDPTGPVGSIAPDIEQASACKVHRMEAQEMAAACGRIHEDILSTPPAFCHVGQDKLDLAAESVAKRQLLDAWAWGRRRSAADISPMVCATLAHWALVTHPVKDSKII